jgi:two-component system cell cycle response regulator
MKLLVVEDDPVTQQAIKKELESEGFEIREAHNGLDALDMIRDDGIRMVIVDWMVPGMNGVTFCRRVRDLNLKRYVYLILLVAQSVQKEGTEGLDVGDDYLTKPLNRFELLSRVKLGVRLLELEDKRVDLQKKLIKLVKEDPLTNLLNRRALFDELVKELSRTVRENLPLATILADVDDFKRINEDYGYVAGDKVLVEFSQRLERLCRPYDIIGRYGGQEFLIILPNTRKINATMVAERIRKAIADKPFTIDGKKVNITACFGLYHFKSLGKSADINVLEHVLDDLINRTDESLSRAKAEGRDNIFVLSE